ncbi:NAD(+) synthase [Halarsenatibacter silvermanii]|uniref:NH(3)-dependent NAD(+) synthetase n=1 Tax=Halarsenatibacter silvermanii TaxID=321763 RepID=A0A1G9ITN9_9FIRM|nr:NAD(+) synthase [Halarsenatibacter silvermanii]SDL28471.1 NAD+ synthase [Halarsenatibacter silvermanii]
MLRKGIEDEITDWLAREVENRGSDGGLIGLSGGIDSTTVAALAKKALGDDCLGILLPAEGTTEKDNEYARMAAESIEIDTMMADLEDINAHLKNFLHGLDLDSVHREYYPETALKASECAREMCEKTMQTRLRMITLYYIGECKNYAVLGTSNKSELLTGYFTRYGDAAADLSPLKHLMKTEVWELAERLEVPREIIDRPPTGGLQSGEERVSDAEEVGLDYRTFDEIYLAIENGKDLRQFDLEDVNRAVELMAEASNNLDIPGFKK